MGAYTHDRALTKSQLCGTRSQTNTWRERFPAEAAARLQFNIIALLRFHFTASFCEKKNKKKTGLELHCMNAYEHGSIDAIPLDVIGNRACVVIGGDSGKEAGGEMGRHVSSVCTVPLEKQSQLRCEIATPGQGSRSRSSRPFRYVSKKNGSPSFCRLVHSYYLLDYTWQFYGWAVTRE